MATEVEPPELAQLLDAAERPRVENWSLRAALTRYAQPEPQRASDVIELLRRIEGALRPFAKLLERSGPAVWAALEQSSDPPPGSPPATGSFPGPDGRVVELLALLRSIDRLGDDLAAWAVDRRGPRPDAAVDEVTAAVAAALDALGVPHEERPRPSGRRG